MPRAIVLDARDNVAILIDPAAAGDIAALTGEAQGEITLREAVPYGHKCATRAIAPGDDILKYGQVVGRAMATIAAGQHVHVHNVESLRARGDLESGRSS